MEVVRYNSEDTEQKKLANDLYAEYLRIIRPFNAELYDKDIPELIMTAVNEVRNAVDTENTDLYFIRVNGVAVGFFILGFSPNAYCLDDVYIQEFYIRKECQRKGYGKSAVKWIVSEHSNKDITLFILKNNAHAFMFWDAVMPEFGYKELTHLDLVTPPSDECFASSRADTVFQYWKKNGFRV